MLISPPFLFERREGSSESQWLDQCFPLLTKPEGLYPVSESLKWHGGLHLQSTAPLRAIADGTVVYKRDPSPRAKGTTVQESPLNYYSDMGVQRWTHDGVLVIRHKTDIGSGLQATEIEFYSIYMHLSSITADLKEGSAVYRKTEIGKAGLEEGQNGLVHLEIVCDQANLKKLVGREQDPLPLNQHGRSDAIYGGLYFIVPANFVIYRFEPSLNDSLPIQSPIIRTTESFLVCLRYEQGHAYLQCRKLTGELIGTERKFEEAEYNLYAKANKISESFKRMQPTLPAPSAVYELLRFGRIINPEHEQLPGYHVPNFWPIEYDGNTHWVDLNNAHIRKFSDADFPPWMGWKLTDDCQDQDIRCDSSTIKKLLDVDCKEGVTPAEAKEKLSKPEVREQLSKLICKFPSEWVRGAFDKRLSWIKNTSIENPFPAKAQEYTDLKQFYEKLAFWEDLNQALQAQGARPLPEMLWHFHPKAFVQHFRMCGWLSADELTQLLPRKSYKYDNTPSSPHLVKLDWVTANGRVRPYQQALNYMFRKYGITSVNRRSHFMGQVFIETDIFRTMREVGKAKPKIEKDGTQKWAAPAMKYYQAFYGRGMMQLTWLGNYMEYFKYRTERGLPNHTGRYTDDRITSSSVHYEANPSDGGKEVTWWPRFDPEIIADNPFEAADSAGWYWVSKVVENKMRSISRVCDQEFSEKKIGRVSVLVNGGGFGYFERQGYARYVYKNSDDSVPFTSRKEDSFDVKRGENTVSVKVNYEAQVK